MINPSSLRRVFALVVVLSILLLAPAVPAQEQSEEMKIVVAAEQFVNQQKPDEALAELQKIFEKTDSFAPAYFVAGLAYEAKNQPQEAFDNFVRAADLNPVWGDAQRKASFFAANLGDLEESWDRAIKAHLAGTDMSDAFEGLQTMGPKPEDFDQRLAAYRVLVAPMNVEQFLAREQNPFGRVIDDAGADFDTDNISNSRNTNVGQQVVSQTAGDRANVLQQTRQKLADSRYFALVGNQNQAQYILVIEVDEIGERGDTRDTRTAENDSNKQPLKGYLNLLDVQSGEQAYRVRINMRNITSQQEVNGDLDRIIGLLEEWAAEQQR